MRAPRSRIDLHCHTSSSFDSNVPPDRIVAAAVRSGLDLIAITDHGRLDGAFRARDTAPERIHVIIGQEIRTTTGDMIGLFLERPVPSGMTAGETAGAIREQGGLVGLAHPFDARRPSTAVGLRRDELDLLAGLVDYIEIHNGRVRDALAGASANELALRSGVPGVAVSDAHTIEEVGRVATVIDGPGDTALRLMGSLRGSIRLNVRHAGDAARPSLVSTLVERLRR
jgi:predicted metal-dependent phosphoesterase TrpH